MSCRAQRGVSLFIDALKVVVPKAPWSAVASATAFSPEFLVGSFAVALQGASRIFIHCAAPQAHEIFAQEDTLALLKPGKRRKVPGVDIAVGKP